MKKNSFFITLAILIGSIFFTCLANADAPTFTVGTVHLTVVSPSEIDLSWTSIPSDQITGYQIERESPAGAGFAVIVSNTNSLTASYNDTNLSPNTEYSYRVSGVNGSGIGPSSLGVAAAATFSAPVVVAPSVPRNLVVTPRSASTIFLNWLAPQSVSSITGYKIEREVGSGFTAIAITTSTNTTYLDTNLSLGGTYSYRVSAINGYGTSDPSFPTIVTIPGLPAAPQNVHAEAGDGLVNLRWLAPPYTVGGITGYVITDAASSSQNVSGTVLSMTIPGLTNGSSYYFFVSAINVSGESARIMTNSVTPRAAVVPHAPATSSQPIASSTPSVTSSFRFTYLLQKGMRGKTVEELQKRLIAEGIYTGSVTGYFGIMTQASLKTYQILHNLEPVGILGPLTRAILNGTH